jgi:hypothetical protein
LHHRSTASSDTKKKIVIHAPGECTQARKKAQACNGYSPYRKLGRIIVLVGVLVEVASKLGGVLVLVRVLVKVASKLGRIIVLVGVLVEVASKLGGVLVLVGIIAKVALNEVELARTAVSTYTQVKQRIPVVTYCAREK